MTYAKWLLDKRIYIVLKVLVYILLSVFLRLIGVNTSAVLFLLFISLGVDIFYMVYEYHRRYYYYKDIEKYLTSLDHKYYLSELIESPNFFEGELIYEIIKISNKSMNDEISFLKREKEEYRDFVETWVHEIKTPLAASKLIIENNKSEVTLSLNEEIDKVYEYVEQTLFYARSNHLEKDYIIKETNLKLLITTVIKKYSKILISYNCEINLSDLDYTVFTDTKWIVFVISQIVSNSIKYKSEKMKLDFYAEIKNNSIILFIRDNGIGISSSEVNKVFDKGFVGANGRKVGKSTGIGLYISKKLCAKMGLSIGIESDINNFTIINITFPKSNMYI